MLATVPAATLLGVQGRRVTVEVHVSNGLPGFTVVGLPDASCREARDRVRAALLSSGLTFPLERVTVNLAPSGLRKVGTGLDLAIALGLLVASGQLTADALQGLSFLGELGLDGAVRPVVGALALCAALGGSRPVVAAADLAEAALIRPDARGVHHLRELVDALTGEAPWPLVDPPRPRTDGVEVPELAEVRGHHVPRLALEVAAAGGHHLLFVGPPGSGKTMLAERLPGLLPDLDDAAALEVSLVHSTVGAMRGTDSLMRRPPYRAPHHTASLAALVGGGSTVLRPGEISLASGGVLFLDELGEYPAGHLDALRQPLESGRIRVSRANVRATLPARFLLVAATNPCPCGQAGFGPCRCTPGQLARYGRRLSGPFLDRFDLRVPVVTPDPSVAVGSGSAGETTAVVRERVHAARARAAARAVPANRSLRGAELAHHAPLSAAAAEVLRSALAAGRLTMRGAERVRAVALTLSDLDGGDGAIGVDHVDLALALRADDRLIGAVA